MAKKDPKKKSKVKPKAKVKAKAAPSRPASSRPAPARPGKKSAASKATASRSSAPVSRSGKPAARSKTSARPAPKQKPVRALPPPTPVSESRTKEKSPEEANPEARPAPKGRGEGDDRAGMDNVMASLTQIFGGREFLSDADLDAFLDSKIASGEIPPSAALDPLDEAQSLIYEAWNSPEPQRIRLAHRALELSPDCADAYVILAEDAKDSKQALEFYRKGAEAGKRALGAQFQKLEGRFWDAMETRPYMRACLGLAESLWDTGKKEESLETMREMLRLNPSDNQGVRYVLIQTLLENGADEEIGKWLQMFKSDPSSSLKYTHALWLFRREGAGAKANAQLEAALKANPHVPPYLLGKIKIPKDLPEAIAPGSEEEAASYAVGAAAPWLKTLGAAEWLAGRARGAG
jgi:tetratricopeptide (TPR) repeat protein